MILTDKQLEKLEQIGQSEGALAMRYYVLKLAIKKDVLEDDIWQEIQIHRKRKELQQNNMRKQAEARIEELQKKIRII